MSMGEQPRPPISSTDGRVADVWFDNQAHLTNIAFRMLGRISDAEDVVQDAFARLMRADLDEINDPRAWLTTVVGRLCIDQLRSARSRREAPTGEDLPDGARPFRPVSLDLDPADRVTLDDSVRMALFVILERLTPAERAAFVLHDIFGFAYDDLSAVVGRTPAACRQLTSRARHRIQAASGPARFDVDLAEQHRVAARFIDACASGRLEALIEILDPDAAGEADVGDLPLPARPVRGRDKVARGVLRFLGPATSTTLVSQPVNGQPGVLGFRDGQLLLVLVLTPGDAGIVDLHAIIDPVKLAYVRSLLETG
jgi:RNA polymerase sigma-70 factor (ECF subfamily)